MKDRETGLIRVDWADPPTLDGPASLVDRLAGVFVCAPEKLAGVILRTPGSVTFDGEATARRTEVMHTIWDAARAKSTPAEKVTR